MLAMYSFRLTTIPPLCSYLLSLLLWPYRVRYPRSCSATLIDGLEDIIFFAMRPFYSSWTGMRNLFSLMGGSDRAGVE